MCGSEDDSRVVADALIDEKALDGYAFASRKLPEYMHHRLVQCPECRLVYSSPIPKIEKLEHAYEEAAFDSSDESEFAARTYGAYLERFMTKLPNLDGALDIGAGDGTFLRELVRLGFRNVVGIEPSAAPIKSAGDDVKELIRPGFFDGKDYEPGTFSLVTCFQTIEHVPHPADLVRDAYTLLKPGGALFIICHNLNGLTAKILGLRSPIFDIEHLQLFTLPTAVDLLTRAGFADVQGQGIKNRYPVHYYLKLLPIPTRVKLPMLKAAQRSALGRVAIPAALGNLMVVGFRASSVTSP